MDEDALDYVAYQLYRATLNLNSLGVRWWCMRKDLKAEYRVQARIQVASWAESERAVSGAMDAEIAAEKKWSEGA